MQRTDRLIALSSFSVWWCMAVLGWLSHLPDYFRWRRMLWLVEIESNVILH